MKSFEEQKREILEVLKKELPEWKVKNVSTKYDDGTFPLQHIIAQALSQLSALDKPRIDEGKLREIVKEIDFNKNMDIVTGAKKVWFSLSGLKKLAHAIDHKIEEILK